GWRLAYSAETRTPAFGSPAAFARRGRATATPRPAPSGTDSSTSVYAVPVFGHAVSPGAAGGVGFVTLLVETAPGAWGSGPVVTVGSGAVGSVFGDAGAVPVPTGPGLTCCVATIVVPELPVVAADTAVATTATTRNKTPGQIQS